MSAGTTNWVPAARASGEPSLSRSTRGAMKPYPGTRRQAGGSFLPLGLSSASSVVTVAVGGADGEGE